MVGSKKSFMTEESIALLESHKQEHRDRREKRMNDRADEVLKKFVEELIMACKYDNRGILKIEMRKIKDIAKKYTTQTIRPKIYDCTDMTEDQIRELKKQINESNDGKI